MLENNNVPGLILYGGSFNPIHIGHLRIAIEISELFAYRTEQLAFIPGFSPPHKNKKNLLPFDMRINMIRASISGFKHFYCEDIERKLSAPSYTFNTLTHLQEKEIGRELYFILGSSDFQLLNTWEKGLQLPFLCHLIIVPRGLFEIEAFYKQCVKYWPAGKAGVNGPKSFHSNTPCASYAIPDGKELYLADAHYLDISGSDIRNLWLSGRSASFLLADEAMRILNNQAEVAKACWQESRDQC